MKQNILYPSRDPDIGGNRAPVYKLEQIFVIFTLLLWLNIVLLQNTYAQDGEALHSNNCVACHAAMTGGDGSVLYTRADRNVKSLEVLNKQVKRCQSSLGLNWSNTEVDSVQQYLNSSYYHF